MFGDPIVTLNGYTLALELIEDSDGFDKQWYCINKPDGDRVDIPAYTYGNTYDGVHVYDWFTNWMELECEDFMFFCHQMHLSNCDERRDYGDKVLSFTEYYMKNSDFIEESYKKQLP